MTQAWYVEKKNVFGKFVPQVMYQDAEPTNKNFVGERRELRNIVPISVTLASRPLDHLHRYFNRQGTDDT